MDSEGNDTAEEKAKDVFKLDDEEKHTESTEKDKQLKKEIRDFLHAGEEMLFINSKVSSSRNQHIQSILGAFEPGEEMLFVNSKVSSSSRNQ